MSGIDVNITRLRVEINLYSCYSTPCRSQLHGDSSVDALSGRTSGSIKTLSPVEWASYPNKLGFVMVPWQLIDRKPEAGLGTDVTSETHDLR